LPSYFDVASVETYSIYIYRYNSFTILHVGVMVLRRDLMPDKEYLKEIQDHEYHDFVKTIKKRKAVTHVETFFNFLDAAHWVEKHLEEYDVKEWYLEQCSINLINGSYRAGVVFSARQGTLL
jgi:hypothetical protein